MTPPRSPDLTAAAVVDPEAEYFAIVKEMAQVQGVINLAQAQLVGLTRRALAVGVSGGDNLTTEAWVRWQAGIAPRQANNIVMLAERADELPATIAALQAGELTIDQAGEIARYVPARFEASAAEVARSLTVRQLRKTLPSYRDPKPDKPKPGEYDEQRRVSSGYDEDGYWCNIRLTAAEGALHDQALNAQYEDLRRQAKAEAKAAGTDPVPVSMADAVVAIDEASLQRGEAARPGTDRYLVHVHLQHGPHGLQLMTDLGIPLPDGERRQILCDARLRALVHDGTTPLGTGRLHRDINRRMRRAILHRDRHTCTMPGCGRTTGLQIHHIWHWEDGGPTETWNLLTLCHYHHTCHHQGTLGIEGNADLPRHQSPGVVFTNNWGHPLDPAGTPITPNQAAAGASAAERANTAAASIGIHPHTYVPPCGERMDYSQFHLNDIALSQPKANPAPTDEPPPEDEPIPTGPLHGPHPFTPAATGRHEPGGADPTRAGPTAA